MIVALSLTIAVMRTIRGPIAFPLRLLGTVYVDVFRGLPLILLLFVLGFGGPALNLSGLPRSAAVLGVHGAGAVLLRLRRRGVPRRHRVRAPVAAAGRSVTGLTSTQTLRHVVLPQAWRRVLPPLMNDLVSLQKDSGLIAVLGVIDAIKAAQIETAQDFNYTPYVVAGFLFLCLTIPMARATDWYARKQGFHGAGGHDVSDGVERGTSERPSSPASDVSDGDERGSSERPSSPVGDVSALLEMRGVRKAFGENVVLRDIDLAVEPGQCVVLIGASGSGKSTLLRCANLLETIDDGVITFEGADISDPGVDGDAVRARMGLVFQAFNLFPHLTVLGNVTLALRKVHGVAAVEADQRGTAMLERVGLAEKSGARPDDLSGGQQQRVAIARALVTNPGLMLLDEVTSALDPELVGEVLDLLTGLRDDGVTMLLNTHEMGFARDVADTVCFLHDGEIHESGTPDQVLGDPQEQRTRAFLSRLRT